LGARLEVAPNGDMTAMRFASPFRRHPSRRLVEAETVVQGSPAVEEEVAAPPPPPPPRGRPPLLWPWLLLLLVLVAGGLVAWWLLSRDDGDHGGTTSSAGAVTVPNVIGQARLEAVARVDRSGLVARVVRRPSGDVPPGRVFAEAPQAGSRVARRTAVTLSVSARASVTVPAVVGQRVAEATAAMRARGLSVRYSGVLSDKARGTVLGQRPAAGAKVARGATVVLRVSRGTGAVPSVVGQKRSVAIATLEAAGFDAQAFVVPAAEPSGTVVAQSPQGGTRVPGGSKVRLYVSGARAASGPPPPPPPAGSTKPATVTVPDVTGQPQEVAQRRLNSTGLKAGLVYVPSQEEQGTVVSESPDSGGKQKRGARIQLNVSLGPTPGEQRAVPDVLGQAPAGAKATLRGAGFQVQTLPQGVTDPNQVGIVVDEQPARGRRAPAGSTVTIYVGRAA
jgi:beta-lactam-binding protein with PASTA domain